MLTVPASTPIYNHPLPEIEKWLKELGCRQDEESLHCWQVERPTWQAELCLEIEELMVRYVDADGSGRDVVRSFKYSLSRQDIESAVFAGP